MNRILFISDAHLGHKNDQDDHVRAEYLQDFFEHVAKSDDSLIIVGDLFDFWFEYKHVIPRRYFHVMCALNRLVKKGNRVEYIIGNHDFGMDTFFSDELGIKVHQGALELHQDGKRLYIAHGDGLAKSDVGYRLLKTILRNRTNIHLYRLLHPDAAFRLALFCSHLSRSHREIKIKDDEYARFAIERFAEGYDGVVLAHTHNPQEYHQSGKTYINTGDWISHFTYGKLEKGRLSLESWPKPEKLNDE